MIVVDIKDSSPELYVDIIIKFNNPQNQLGSPFQYPQGSLAIEFLIVMFERWQA